MLIISGIVYFKNIKKNFIIFKISNLKKIKFCIKKNKSIINLIKIKRIISIIGVIKKKFLKIYKINNITYISSVLKFFKKNF